MTPSFPEVVRDGAEALRMLEGFLAEGHRVALYGGGTQPGDEVYGYLCAFAPPMELVSAVPLTAEAHAAVSRDEAQKEQVGS